MLYANSYFIDEIPSNKEPAWAKLLLKLAENPTSSYFKNVFLDYAQIQITHYCKFDKLNAQVETDLLNQLVQRLDQLCEQTVQQQTGLKYRSLFGLKTIQAPIELDFSHTLLKYPVLARLSAQLTIDTLNFIKNFLNHLKMDWFLLEQHSQQKLHQVTQIIPNLSDPHHQGRTVQIIIFDNQLKWVYKPRNLSMEVFYFEVIRRLNPFISLPLKIVKVISQHYYGWMEYIEKNNDLNTLEKQNYSQRYGYILALAHILRGSDFHSENLIQQGDQPILIDLETLLQPHESYHLSLFSSAQRFLKGILATHLCETIGKNCSLKLLETGFKEAYQVISKHSLLKKSEYPIKTRVIYQDTQLYQNLLNYALQPQYLENGQIFSQQFEILKKSKLERYNKEYQMLTQLDIPYFQVNTQFKSIDLTQQDLNQQLYYLQQCFYLKNPDNNPLSTVKFQNQSKKNIKKQIKTLCEQQVNHILNRSEQSVDGQIYWFVIKGNRFFMTDHGLYEGNMGILLFLSAAYKINPKPTLKRFILSALEPLLKSFENGTLIAYLNLGMATGLAGIIYGLCVISQLIAQERLLNNAIQIIQQIEVQRIEQDKALDILNGSAGLLLAFIYCYQLKPQTSLLKKAKICATHLLNQQGHNGEWKTLEQTAMAGFGHGIAGIASSLLHFYSLYPQKKYLMAAEKALLFENTFFDKQQKQWRAMASTAESPSFWQGFCHGAAGIGLSRLCYLQYNIQSPISQNDLDNTLSIAKQNNITEFDFPCCGETAKLELLLAANLQPEAWQKAAWILQRKQQNKAFYLYDEYHSKVDNLSFFKGSTGSTYQLLRLCYPEQLPSVLMFRSLNESLPECPDFLNNLPPH